MTGTAAKTGTAPLKHIAQIMVSNVDKKAVEGELAVRLCNYVDVYKHDAITDELPFMDATASMEQIARFTLRAGDVLITKDSETPEDIAVGAYVPEDLPGVVCGYHLAILRPRGLDVDGRYLHWAISSAVVSGQFHASALGITRFGLRQSAIGEIEVPVPTAAQQRSIADYLDRETAQIDALIEKRERLIELTEERWQGLLETRIRKLSDAWGDVPLKYACREIVVGIVVTPSAWYAESGVVALRGVNIAPGEIRLDDVVYLTEEGHALHDKSRLSEGDVVIVRTGQAGAAAVVPPALKGANCVDLVIARPRADLRPHFLEYVLNSDWMQKHIEKNSVGTIQSHFNVGAAKKAPIPMAPLPEQDRTVDDLRTARTSAVAIIEKFSRQVSVLKERRQALITAAVTGQLDVSEAG